LSEFYRHKTKIYENEVIVNKPFLLSDRFSTIDIISELWFNINRKYADYYAMYNTEKKMPAPSDIERAERLREVLAALYEANKKFPVIVEGKKDAIALKKLGLEGEIITLHSGKGLYDFCEDIAQNFPKVIILLDWDDKGEALFRSVSRNLSGHGDEFLAFRGIIKMLCQKDIKDIEGIPRLLLRLEGMQFGDRII
jgi:5S rRNA maturation endonuclease (ribonuclease M5)